MRSILIILFILLAHPALGFDLFDSNETKIKKQIEAANYCNKTSDCVVESFICLGDMSYVNKGEVSKLKASFSNLDYKCLVDRDYTFLDKFPVCENQKCVKASDSARIYESYKCDEIRPALEVELGQFKYCEQDSDCVHQSCILGCQDVVTERFRDEDRVLFMDYDKYCRPYCGIKKCPPPKKMGCVNNSCAVINN